MGRSIALTTSTGNDFPAHGNNHAADVKIKSADQISHPRALASISANPQRSPRVQQPKKSLKRRAISPAPQNHPSQRSKTTAAEQPQRRSARLASLRMSKPNNASSPEQDMDPGIGPSKGHSMTMRGRTVAPGPPSTPVRNTFGSLNGAPIPQLHPTTTPSRTKSMSPGRSKSNSPSRSLAQTSTSTSSKGISKKEHLAQMQPVTTFGDIEDIKDSSVPESVKSFWRNYIAPAVAERQIVPIELKKPLEDRWNTPMKTKPEIEPSHFGSNIFGHDEMGNVLRIVMNVLEQAKKYRGKSQEPQWVSAVVGYLIMELQYLSLATSKDGSKIESLNVSAASIAPHELCPTSLAQNFADADKKIDYALAIPLSEAEELALTSAVKKYKIPGAASINQTQGIYTALKAMFAHQEVKVDHRDPLIQLAVWIAAEFEKRSREGYPIDIPVPAVAVYEDSWQLWIAYSIKLTGKEKVTGGKPYRIKFLGPVQIGNTSSTEGVFRILHIMAAIVKWGFEVYKLEYLTKVLAKYMKK
ncbi:MAG: hypothetical protein Q9170_007468 [Blastenia crenularia]